MELIRPLALAALCVLLAATVAATAAPATEVEAQSSYIVHVAAEHAPRLPRRGLLTTRAYGSFLRDHIPGEMSSPAPAVLYSYAHAATGFAARLTERQAELLASSSSVLAVVPDTMQELHTTLTPSFLGLSPSSGLLKASNGATDVVIGVIDTGVYPEGRPSFAADPSLPPPPSKFRGRCVSGPSFNGSALCNNKLVGAKFFQRGQEALRGRALGADSKSALDTNGHGTHTSSTAGGSAVADAGFFDYARGKAVGMAPGARIAVYKACWEGCASSDILAAFDEAIADGVDVISVSLGAVGSAPDFYGDTTAVGAFRAVRRGIVVSASAGNSGPGDSTACNIAPWFLTVGASTLNRQFPGDVVLGNGETFTGTTLYAGEPLGPTKIPLVYGGDVGSKACEEGKLNATKVAGKIVLCEPGVNARAAKPLAVKLAGGAGAILASTQPFGEQALTTPHVHPATAVAFVDGAKIFKYIRAQASPTATIIFRGTVVGTTPPSPRMAAFSSRGPNLRAPEIFKPDVTAPGVDILAAWTGANSPTELDSDTRRVKYNIISGTSMSCPHVSGIAALLRQARPEWSPAAIKSALMTTAYNVAGANRRPLTSASSGQQHKNQQASASAGQATAPHPSHGALLHPTLVSAGRPGGLFSPTTQPRCPPATRQHQGRRAVSVREVRAEQQAGRRQRRRRVGEPPGHDELRRGGRRRGVHRQGPRRELRRGNAGAGAGAGGVGARHRAGRPLHRTVRSARLMDPSREVIEDLFFSRIYTK